jgi:hypothetical protein
MYVAENRQALELISTRMLTGAAVEEHHKQAS